MHYAKKEDFKYPLFFSFLLVDESVAKGIPVTVWNKLALECYESLHIGDEILLEKFRVKNYYDAGLFPSDKSFTKELSLNTKKSSLYKIKAQVPFLNLKTLSIHELQFLPDQVSWCIRSITQ
jgi:hypothetical protein